MAKAGGGRPRCPECGALLTRGREAGPCRRCGWEEEAPPARASGRRAARPSARATGGGLSPVALGLIIGGGAGVLLLLLLALAGKGGGEPSPGPQAGGGEAGAGQPDEPDQPEPPRPRTPRELWPGRFEQAMARLSIERSLTPPLREELDRLRKDAILYGTKEQADRILDLWVKLDPEDEKVRRLRGDVLYTGPFRRQVEGRWRWPVHPKTGEKTRIWITREESEALDNDQLYKAAVRAVQTARAIDGKQGESKAYHTFFFFDDDVAPRPFLIASQSKTPSFAKDRAESTAATVAALRRSTFGLHGEPMRMVNGDREFLVPMFVFGGPDVYDEFRKRSSAEGLPSPFSVAGFFTYNPEFEPIGWLFVWAEDPKAKHFIDVIAHEATHLFQWQYGKSNTPANRRNPALRSMGSTCWFQEGLAEYWGGGVLREWQGMEIYQPGRLQSGRLAHLMRFLPKKGEDPPRSMPEGEAGYMPVRQMCRRSYAAYNREFNYRANSGNQVAKEMVGLFYAEGWAFVHFLMHYQGGIYRTHLLRYMVSELNCDFDWHLWEKLLGIKGTREWQELDRKFIAYVHDELWPLFEKPGKVGRAGLGKWHDEELAALGRAIKRNEAGEGKKGGGE